MKRDRHGLARSLILLLAPLAILASSPLPPASAAPGTWGGLPYVDGVVCNVPSANAPNTTVPLVSWSFKGGNSPGFLLSMIDNVPGPDSGTPPVGNDAQVTSSNAAANTVGGTQNAAALAYLITHYGSGNSAKVGEVAAQVAQTGGGISTASCLAGAMGGMSRTDAASIWQTSQQLAGPYTVNVTGTPKAGADSTLNVEVSVNSATNQPVPATTVTLSAPGATVPTAQAKTGTNGVATFTVKAPTAATLDLTATVSAATTLNVISAPNSTIFGVAAAPPTTATGTATVAVNAAATPTISTSLSLPGTNLGVVVHSTVKVTGMHSHNGVVTTSVNGPLPLGANAACPATVDPYATSPIVNQASTNIGGDGSISGPDISPSAGGCYALTATVTTTDSSPNVSAKTSAPSVLTVLPTTVAMTLPNDGLVGRGKTQLTAVVSASLGLPGQLTGTVYGPLPIANGVCTGLTWNGAPVLGQLAAVTTHGDGNFNLPTPEFAEPGCYAASLHAKVGPLGLDLPTGSGTSTWTVLSPSVSTMQDTTWVTLGNPIASSVSVAGTWTQKGKLNLTLYQVPEPATGCLSADWSTPTKLMIGNDVPFTGDGVYTVKSALVAKAGCYSVVPTVTLDANRTITAVGAIGEPASIVQAASAVAQTTASDNNTKTPMPLRIFLLTGGIFGTFVLAAAAGTVALARRQAWPMGAL